MQSVRSLDSEARRWTESALARAQPLTTDVLVLGAGLAGLRAAVRARESGREVTIAYEGRGASPFIIGCNAPFAHADPADTPAVYARDVLAGGYELSDRPLVETLVHRATCGVCELAEIGAPIARDGQRFLQRQLSGNWHPRSVYHPDGLGAQALPCLSTHATRIGVQALPGHTAIRLLMHRGRPCGALLRERRSGTWKPVLAPAVVIALGGLGRLYDDSTYPGDVVGTSYALGYEVGAALVDMEFVQFEPLCTFVPEALKGLELPTSMLVEGAQLLNRNGERFMFRHNPDGGEGRIEKARLSLCIQEEIDEGRGIDGGVIYDATRVPPAVIEGYVRHCRRLRKAGLDPLKLRVPVRPAAHSLMGGLWIDARASTSVHGLYAAGEAAGGLHGASRIAGNGGADALVFGDVAGASAAAQPGTSFTDASAALREAFEAVASVGRPQGSQHASDVRTRVRTALSHGAGIYRTAEGLRAALDELDESAERLRFDGHAADDETRVEAFTTLGMTQVARAVTAAALTRSESRGAHQRRDHPLTDERWRTHVVVSKDAQGRMVVTTRPVRDRIADTEINERHDASIR